MFYFQETNDPLFKKLFIQYIKPELEKGNIGNSKTIFKNFDYDKLFTFVYVESAAKEVFKTKPYKIYYFPFMNEPIDFSITINKYSPYERFFNYMYVS